MAMAGRAPVRPAQQERGFQAQAEILRVANLEAADSLALEAQLLLQGAAVVRMAGAVELVALEVLVVRLRVVTQALPVRLALAVVLVPVGQAEWPALPALILRVQTLIHRHCARAKRLSTTAPFSARARGLVQPCARAISARRVWVRQQLNAWIA